MTSDILNILIRTNLAVAAAVVAVLLARRSVRTAFGARVAYALWLAVPLAGLACLLPARSVVVVVRQAAGASQSLPQSPADPAPDGSGLMIALWIAGLAASGLLLAWRQHRFVASLGAVRADGAYLRAAASGVGPAVLGAIFPRILIPADFETCFDARERDMVLAHEKAHLASGDAAVNAAAALAQCLLWFNPMVHIAARALRVDQELACDAAVLSARPQDRKIYAAALLKAQLHTRPLPLGCYWPATGAHPLKERIAMLKMPMPSTARRILGAAGVAVLCLGAGAAAWAAQPARSITTYADAPWIVDTAQTPYGAAPANNLAKKLPQNLRRTGLAQSARKNNVSRTLEIHGVSKTIRNHGVSRTIETHSLSRTMQSRGVRRLFTTSLTTAAAADTASNGGTDIRIGQDIYPVAPAQTTAPASSAQDAAADGGFQSATLRGPTIAMNLTGAGGGQREIQVRYAVAGQPDRIVTLPVGPGSAMTIPPLAP